MSTRATYEFVDEMDSFTVYKHYDGYPRCGLAAIANAQSMAWPLPRFEASDFAAAFVAANKTRGGDVYLTTGKDAHGDTEFHYQVREDGGTLLVKVWSLHSGGHDKLVASGSINELLAAHGVTRV